MVSYEPIGLSVVRLHSVQDATLHVTGIGLLDGTPVLDIKPYVVLFRCRPSVRRGSFTVPPGSPLAFVHRARKLISVGMRDFDFTFGV